VPIILGWIVLAIIVGVAANTRGRSPVGWTLLALVVSPLIAGLLVLALPNMHTEFAVDENALRRNVRGPRQSPWSRWALPIIVIAPLALAVWMVSTSPHSNSTTAAATIGGEAPQNGANTYLLSLSPDARGQMLGKTVGDKCSAKSTFYMGIGTSDFSKGKAFWSVQCRDGRAFAVEANPDGTNTVLECSLLKSMHAGECFKKLD